MHHAAIAAIVALAAAIPAAARAADDPGPLRDAKLLQVTLPAKDLGRSVAFYRDILGLKLLFEVPGASFLDAGGVRLRLERSDGPAPQGVELYFDDPQLAHAGPLRARGIRFVGPPETVQRKASADLQLLEFFDPDGNALALMGDVSRAAAAHP
jgi:methylmalonyl-CoA/ethylmalonyl-CoA epimerase